MSNPEFNPCLAFIETDEHDCPYHLGLFVADGGTRSVSYHSGDCGFRFEYRMDERYLAYLLPDEVNDPSERERLVLSMEKTGLQQLKVSRGAGETS